MESVGPQSNDNIILCRNGAQRGKQVRFPSSLAEEVVETIHICGAVQP